LKKLSFNIPSEVTMSELWKRGAAELADLIQGRKVSCREVVDAHILRIENANVNLNAVTVVLKDTALQAADAADRALAAGEPVGELCGVPFTVKEGIDVLGSATTHGLAPLKNALAQRDSPVVAALRAAGAIPIARTNMPEFGMRWHTTNGLHGATKNPWDSNRTPGGSSGGEAAAIASGMSPLGIGSDGAGSLRWPAQCCGIVALKPSHGRVPVVPSGPFPFAFQLLAVLGPMARRVDDLRLAFRHMCGESSGDPWHVPASFEWPPVRKPIHVAVMVDPGGMGVHPDVARSVDLASAMLADAGYVIEAREAPLLQRASEIYVQIMSRFGRTSAEPERAPVGLVSAEFDQFWAMFHQPWERAAGKATHDPMMERVTIYREWAELMNECPLILAPISTQPAFLVGEDIDPAWGDRWMVALRMIMAPSLLGLPSVAVPAELSGGMPDGVQIIGPRFREDLCLEAAHAIESRSLVVPAFDSGPSWKGDSPNSNLTKSR
jgi:amidase